MKTVEVIWRDLHLITFFIVKPFANEDEYKKTEEIVQKFQDGVGKTLHQKLLERAKGKRNWVFILYTYNGKLDI